MSGAAPGRAVPLRFGPTRGRLPIVARLAAFVGLALPALPGGVAAQERPGAPPDGAVSVPLGRTAAPPRVEILVASGPIEVREHAGADVLYLAQGPVEGQVVAAVDRAGVARFIGGERLEHLAVWVPRGASIRIGSAAGGGHIEVAGATGAVEIVSERGSIRVSGAPTSLLIDASHGSVQLQLEAFGAGPHSIAIHDGSLFLGLPAGSGVDLDTRTLFNGSFVTNLPHEGVETPAGPRTRVAGGGPTLRVSLWNGSLHVTRAR